MSEIVVGITGASGAVYAKKLLETLAAEKHRIHLVASKTGAEIFRSENDVDVAQLAEAEPEWIKCYRNDDLHAPIASGSFQTGGMAVVPASMDVCGAIASGLAPTLITRAAAVTMKEGRRLVVVPRETPMSAVHLDNLAKLARAGVVVMPACPAFYTGPLQVGDLVDFMVQRICDALGIEVEIAPRWSR
ncbi:MAG: UbiX family flavin prenyltransferase [Planctomycetota bacterium]|nr:MAG: UbiX family flavin prenyltransferase [Planctomycetota bacterium]